MLFDSKSNNLGLWLVNKAPLLVVIDGESDAPKDYGTAIVAVWRLSAETIYWTNFFSFGKYESFAHPNI